MSARRSLVSRQQRDAPLPVRRPHQSDSQFRQSPSLPPYEPPTFPLTETVRRSLSDLPSDLRKYEKQTRFAIRNITESAAEINDQLYESKNRLKKLVERREAADGHQEKTREEERAEKRVQELEEVVKKLTADSEKAIRDLIDYTREIENQKPMLRDVAEAAAAASAMGMSSAAPSRKNGAGRSRRRQAGSSASDDDDEEMDEDIPEADATIPVSVLSLTELLKKAKEDAAAEYNSKTMRERYADHNDYKNFRRVIHDALYPGENVPHSSTWFPSENTNMPSSASAARRRRLATTTDHTGNADDDDDEDIQITGAVSSLRCPITLQLFKEPYSNRKCQHTFEKSAILQLHHDNAVAYSGPSQGRRGLGVPQGPKRLKCPESSCEAMLELDDFYENQLILRQVKRREAEVAQEMEDDEMADSDVDDNQSQFSEVEEEASRGHGQKAPPGYQETSSDDGLEVIEMEE